jgi:hypothetical protein
MIVAAHIIMEPVEVGFADERRIIARRSAEKAAVAMIP